MSKTKQKIFNSFMMGGFEAACHINGQGRRLDMIAQTQHDIQAEADYALVKTEGIRTVRDGVRWPLIEKARGVYDFSSLEHMALAAKNHGVQVIWTLCHYGWPDDLDIFAPEFITRFAAFGKAVAVFLEPYSDQGLFFTPVNEISFFSLIAGEIGTVYPHARDRGVELKEQLVRATLACTDAIREVCPHARFVQIEPLINVINPNVPQARSAAAQAEHDEQFEAFNMIAGLTKPELGGATGYLDIIGSNFYYENQWYENGKRNYYFQETPAEGWVPLHRLILDLYAVYKRPMILGETSHFGTNRPYWMRMIIDEVQQVLAHDVPFLGICLYPIIDRSDWEDDDHWHNSGLWDYNMGENGRHLRVLADDYAIEVRRAVHLFDTAA